MDKQIAVWNTGRKYQQHGQVIAAVAVEGGVVFADVSRMVDGFVKADAELFSGLQEMAMWGYDNGKYDFVDSDEQRAALQAARKAAFDFVATI